MSDSSDEEMEMPVVKTRIPQRNPPRPPPTTSGPPIPHRTQSPMPSPVVGNRTTNPKNIPMTQVKIKRKSTMPKAKTDKQTQIQIDSLLQQNERLRGLVTSLTSRLELLELNQYKITDACDEIKSIKEALNESPAFAKKDRSSVLDRSALIPVLQRGVTSDASEILDLIENDKAIYYSGWMNKKGRKVRNWKRRWFVLKGHRLSYFEKENDKKSLGEINLETCMVDELKEREESQRPCMALLVEGRKLLFCADTAEENLRWYLYLMCKNSELSYLRKLKHTNQLADNALLEFLEQPMVSQLRMDNQTLSIDSIVALTGPTRIHDNLHSLSLRYAKLNDLAISTLSESIKLNKSIEILDLEGNLITEEGAKALSIAIDANGPLRKLILKENKIGNNGIMSISKVILSGSNTHLEYLDLTNNSIGYEGAQAYADSLKNNKNIVEIHLDDNNIGDCGATCFIELCQTNTSISILRLQNNNITDDGVLSISEKLKTNKSLKRLYLSYNTLSKHAYQTMIKTLMINRSLEFIEFADYRLETTDLCSLRLLNDCNLLKLS